MQNVAANVARSEAYTPTGATIEQRLESVAVTVLEWILLSDSTAGVGIALVPSSVRRLGRNDVKYLALDEPEITSPIRLGFLPTSFSA